MFKFILTIPLLFTFSLAQAVDKNCSTENYKRIYPIAKKMIQDFCPDEKITPFFDIHEDGGVYHQFDWAIEEMNDIATLKYGYSFDPKAVHESVLYDDIDACKEDPANYSHILPWEDFYKKANPQLFRKITTRCIALSICKLESKD